jgi:hypothetical protein
MTRDILDELEQQRRQPAYRVVAARVGDLVEDRSSGFCGDIVTVAAESVSVRDRNGRTREFRFKPGGFLIEGKAVTLVRQQRAGGARRLTNSGAIAGPAQRAQVALASRIWVEGRHDAELLQHVWGAELAELAIVVEPTHGIDDLVTGSKEQRITRQVTGPNVLVTGHPFVDVWAGIHPQVVNLAEWPHVPRGVEWKQGMCDALGVSLSDFWPNLRNRVRTFADLRPELVGAVEQLIDFVAPAPAADAAGD